MEHGTTKERGPRYRRGIRRLGSALILIGVALLGVTGALVTLEHRVPREQPVVPSAAAPPPTPGAPLPLIAPESGAVPVGASSSHDGDTGDPERLPPPERVWIPGRGVDAPVEAVGYRYLTIEGQTVVQWEVADDAASHLEGSPAPGEGGNVVLTGHDDWGAEVFRSLEQVEVGDEVFVSTAEAVHRYVVAEIHYRREAGVPLAERLATAEFIAPMAQERLTLVTCWPYLVDTHRLIIVAFPVGEEASSK